jgi:hypothetical protein
LVRRSLEGTPPPLPSPLFLCPSLLGGGGRRGKGEGMWRRRFSFGLAALVRIKGLVLALDLFLPLAPVIILGAKGHVQAKKKKA